MLAISIMLMILGVQINHFFTKKEMESYSGVSAVGNVYTHPESMTTCESISRDERRLFSGL